MIDSLHVPFCSLAIDGVGWHRLVAMAQQIGRDSAMLLAWMCRGLPSGRLNWIGCDFTCTHAGRHLVGVHCVNGVVEFCRMLGYSESE